MARENMVKFDFPAFGKAMLTAIDSVRVRQKDVFQDLAKSPRGNDAFEPRINAFFRMVGFQPYYFGNIEQDVMKQYVETGGKQQREDRIDERTNKTEQNLSKTEEQKLVLALDSIFNPNNPPPNEHLIFPLVQNGLYDIANNKRIAEPFERENLEEKLPRCLLEAIIDIRVNKFKSSILSDGVRTYFQNLFSSGDDGVLARFYGGDINTYSALALLALKNFDLIATKVVEYDLLLQRDKENILTEINFGPVPTITGLPTAKNNNKQDFGLGVYAKKNNLLNKLQTYKSILDSVVSLAVDTTTDTGASTKSDRKIDFIKDNSFLGPFMSIIQADSKWFDGEIKRIQSDIKKLEVKMEQIRLGLDMIYGTTTGISMRDVFCILWSLMEIDEQYLVGLLTDQQYENYQQFNKERKFDFTIERADITTSYTMLEKNIISKLEILNERSIAASKKKSMVNRNKRGSGKTRRS